MPRKNNNATSNTQSKPKMPDFIKVDSFEVKRAVEVSFQGNTSILADVTINGITIYGIKPITYKKQDGTESDFLGWPERKGKDGKYYKVCWAPLRDGDQEVIANAIYAKLDGNG